MKELRNLLGGTYDSFDVSLLARLAAGLETASFYSRYARTARSFKSKADMHKFGLELTTATGYVMEFGVASGSTVNLIADFVPNRRVFGFDVFTGLPENWRTGFPGGAFSQQGQLPEVRDNVELVVGLFEDTLPDWLQSNEGFISYLHVDSDLYSAAKTIFSLAGCRLRAGSIIAFDEYWNYPGWQEDGFKAFQEFLQSSCHCIEYLGFVPTHQQVLIRLT